MTAMIRASTSSAPTRVTLVEDDEALAGMLRYNMEAAGFAVELIACGLSALARLKDHPPDVLILDWMLPGLSGIEILRRLRASTGTASLPVLMLTGRVEPEDRARALATGATAFVAKPFSVQEIMASVSALSDQGRTARVHGAA